MIPAIILFALGIGDWLTTRAILARPGGEENNPLAEWFMVRMGQTPFLVGKAAFMGLAGWLAAPWAWLWIPAALIYAGFVANNVRVMRAQ